MTLPKDFASKIWSLVSSVSHIFERDPARCQSQRVHLNMRRIGTFAADDDLGDAADGRNFLRQNGISVVVEPVIRQRVRPNCENQYRPVRRIGFPIGRRIGQILRQQSAGSVDCRLDIRSGAVDVPVEIELQRDRRRTDTARRRHLREARNRGELLFERCRDRGCHGIRASTRKSGANRNCRKVDIRQSRDWQKAKRTGAKHEQAQHQERRRDGAADEGFGDIHRTCTTGCIGDRRIMSRRCCAGTRTPAVSTNPGLVCIDRRRPPGRPAPGPDRPRLCRRR